MTAIYGLYQTPQAAQSAFDELRAAGIAAGDITVMSSEPLEEWEFAMHDRKTVMPWIAVGGAGLGCITAYFLTSVTQQAWPINTGGMPIVSNWTNIIILFELTMLGAVLATVVALLMTAHLPARLSTLHDRTVSDGRILVGVVRPRDDAFGGIERALRAAGAEIIARRE